MMENPEAKVGNHPALRGRGFWGIFEAMHFFEKFYPLKIK
jgi:hypothetical protein